MAEHGFKTVEDFIGYPEYIEYSGDLDFQRFVFHPSDEDHPGGGTYHRRAMERRNTMVPIDTRVDDIILEEALEAIKSGEDSIVVGGGPGNRIKVTNEDRSSLARVMFEIVQAHGHRLSLIHI